MHLVNVMEQLVIDTVEDMLKESNMCTCDRCRLDIAAIALNNLAPVYVVTAEGKSIMSNMSQYRVDAMRMVSKAMEVVRKSPHHR